MKIAWHAIALVMSLAGSQSAYARDWFDFDREEGLRRIRAAVERLEAVAPIPPLQCRPRAMILRYCFVKIAPGPEIEVTTTLGIDPHQATATDHGRFMENENVGKVYEIEVRIGNRDERAEQAAAMFVSLCPAIILAVRPSLGARGATQRFTTYMRRSINKAATGDGEVKLVGTPETLIIDSWRDGSAYCKVSAEDDHRLPN